MLTQTTLCLYTQPQQPSLAEAAPIYLVLWYEPQQPRFAPNRYPCTLRYCEQHASLHGHKCAFWIDSPPCANTRQDNRLTCDEHAGEEDEFNRRNREASWTAAQRARFLEREVGAFTTFSLHAPTGETQGKICRTCLFSWNNKQAALLYR